MSREDAQQLKIFAGRNAAVLASRICTHLELPLGAARTEVFPDGEIIVKLDEDVRGRDCYVVLSTCTPVNDSLMELLIYIDCLKRASARRVTVVVPYFGYARQDRKDEGRVPITAKLVANLITKAGADRLVSIDLHAAQLQGFFDIPVDHLSATPVFYDYFMTIRDELKDLCLVSPDVGNVKVSESFANLLGGELAIIHKRRVSGSEVRTDAIIGNVKGKTVLMYDDMITTGGTIVEAARLVLEKGATRVIAAATHPVMVGLAMERLSGSPISRVVCTNTIPGGERLAPIKDRYVELCVANMLGEAIHRIHHNMSVSALFRKTAGAKR
ncbi:MAG TPA: ribose-phosphate pyrophosphokinase [Phycisphaerales bacterium]|jgi:ribose-phosphate pyrophosphokinase|nr:ribose-phosphate pyrophosphokinase [Phycisphaerales bacterium]